LCRQMLFHCNLAFRGFRPSLRLRHFHLSPKPSITARTWYLLGRLRHPLATCRLRRLHRPDPRGQPLSHLLPAPRLACHAPMYRGVFHQTLVRWPNGYVRHASYRYLRAGPFGTSADGAHCRASRTATAAGAAPIRDALRNPHSTEAATYANTTSVIRSRCSVGMKVARKQPRAASPARRIVRDTRRSTIRILYASGTVATDYSVVLITWYVTLVESRLLVSAAVLT